jgi:hypothetical protein
MTQNKIISKLILVSMALAFLPGCDIEPEYFSEVSPETFLDSKEKIYQRVAQPFEYWAVTVGSPRSGLTFMQEFTSDELCMPARGVHWYDNGIYVAPYYHNLTPWTFDVGGTWGAFSTGVVRALNTVIELDNVDFTAMKIPDETRDEMYAQLYALTAYFYLIGLDNFGGIPLYTVDEVKAGLIKGRSTDEETFQRIEELLTDAISKLPKRDGTAGVNGYISRAAAATLLARLYFNAESYIRQNKFAECAQICEKIKAGEYGTYALADDFRKVFGWNNEKCPEIIWGIPSDNTHRKVNGSNFEHAFHYATKIYLDNPEAESWNGFCLTPSLDKYGVSYGVENSAYVVGSENVAYGNGGNTFVRKSFKLGRPFEKFENTDLRKKLYLYKGNGEYEGMFIMGNLTNPIAKVTAFYVGDNEYEKTDTVNMVDQIAYLTKSAASIEKYNKTHADKPRAFDAAAFNEGVAYGEENSGIRLMKATPVPNAADKALWYNPEVPVIRYAEIYYMLAECKFRAGDKSGAAQLINDVRKRYFEGGADPNPVPSSFDEYRLLDEWMIEFLGEGRRRTDLVRWDKYTTEDWFDHLADGDSKYNRFPIPATAINANNIIKQNEGY